MPAKALLLPPQVCPGCYCCEPGTQRSTRASRHKQVRKTLDAVLISFFLGNVWRFSQETIHFWTRNTSCWISSKNFWLTTSHLSVRILNHVRLGVKADCLWRGHQLVENSVSEEILRSETTVAVTLPPFDISLVLPHSLEHITCLQYISSWKCFCESETAWHAAWYLIDSCKTQRFKIKKSDFAMWMARHSTLAEKNFDPLKIRCHAHVWIFPQLHA